MDKDSNILIQTLKASLFLDFNKESFQLNQKLSSYLPIWIWAGALLLVSSVASYLHITWRTYVTLLLFFSFIYLAYIPILSTMFNVI